MRLAQHPLIVRKRLLQSEKVVCVGDDTDILACITQQNLAALKLTLDVSEINANLSVVANDQVIRCHHSLADARDDLWFRRQHAGHGSDQPSRPRYAAEIEGGAAKARFDVARLASRGVEEADEAGKGTPQTPQHQAKGQPGKRELRFRCPDRGDISEEQMLFVCYQIW